MEPRKIAINITDISPLFFFTRKTLLRTIAANEYRIFLTGMQQGCEDLINERGIFYQEICFSRAGANFCADLKLLKSYHSFFKELRPDVVLSYNAKPNIYGSIAARAAGVRGIYPVVNGLGYVFTDGGLKKKLVRLVMLRLYKRAFSCAAKVFFQNPDDAEEMIKRGIIERSKCVVVAGSGIDLQAYPYSEMRSENVFFMATRLLRTKGLPEYLAAARIVKAKHPQARFLLAGRFDPNPDGIRREELEPYTADGSVEYLGVVDDMPSALAECSVFVLPSWYREGVPHAVLEAMSTGRAIITTDAPGCRETIRSADGAGKGLNGFAIRPRDAEALAEAMAWMIDHPDEARQMGVESRKYAEERFDVNGVNEAMMKAMGLI